MTAEGAEKYRAVNQEIKKSMTYSVNCQDMEDNIRKNYNNSKKAYHLVKTLTSTKRGQTNTIQDKNGKCLTKIQDNLRGGKNTALNGSATQSKVTQRY